MPHRSAFSRYRAEADFALRRLKRCHEDGDAARAEEWHRAWSLAQTAADAELREKGAGARVVRLKNPPPLRPLPADMTPLSLPPIPQLAPESQTAAAPVLTTPALQDSADPLTAALERHGRIERALRTGGPNAVPDELAEEAWQEQLAAFQYGGPGDCELLQEAEAAVEALVEMLPAYWEPEEANEDEPHVAPVPLETGAFPECVRIYRESLPELTEDELRADLETCLSAGRQDTTALIEEELRRREREEPPPPLPDSEPSCIHEPGSAVSTGAKSAEPEPAPPFLYPHNGSRARAAPRSRPAAAPLQPEPSTPGYTTAPAWVDTAGRTRTWNLLDPTGEKLAEIATKRDAEKLAALLTRLLGTSFPPE